MFKSIFPYLVLIIAVICGTASNSFANSANGFTKLVPSIYSIITIILCMYLLSQVMKFLPVGITYATFAGLCIIGTSFVGIIKFSQIPSFSTIIGLMLIISGVLIVNLLGNDQIGAGIVAASLPLTLRISEMSWWIMWEVSYLFENIGTIDEGRLTISQKPKVIDAPDAKELSIKGGEINFSKVKFNYGKRGGLFEELSLKINKGEVTAFVGASGAGKSTMMALILKFITPTTGDIYVDEKNLKLLLQ